MNHLCITILLVLLPCLALARSGGAEASVNLTTSGAGITALALFAASYCLIILEEFLHMRKSKPMLLAAGLIWMLYALTMAGLGDNHAAEEAISRNLLEYVELFLFLLAAMTYINALEERNVFQALRSRLVSRGLSLRAIFWLTGLLAFCISPVADNLTTALLMGAVVMAMGGGNRRFITLCCINIVVAANAGGAFSPFGDITTLMVWQKGKVDFFQFFALFLPSLVNWLIPALCMHFAIPHGAAASTGETSPMKFGAGIIMALFLITITTAVIFHHSLHLPPAAGMMLGLGLLGLFSYYIKKREHRRFAPESLPGIDARDNGNGSAPEHFDFMRKVSRAEWDTLLFFYGVILSVGGLAQFGYLAAVSRFGYEGMGPTTANILVGIVSALVDNIPVMFAVLTMDPAMSEGQWLLVTFTAGVGGSLLSIGSAAGVALMGTARGEYTFATHLRWTPAIALGYAASIWLHLLINRSLF